MSKYEAEGSVKTTFYGIIPMLLVFSKTEMSGKKGMGIVYTLHITPFMGISFIIPSFLLKRR